MAHYFSLSALHCKNNNYNIKDQELFSQAVFEEVKNNVVTNFLFIGEQKYNKNTSQSSQSA